MSLHQRILVGIDLHQGDRVAIGEFGPETRAVIEESLLLAAHAGAHVTFCAVLDLSPQTASLIEKDHQSLIRTVEDTAAEILDGVVAEAAARGVAADRVIRIGAPGEHLCRLAIEGKYDLIVVATRSRSHASRLFFGSTAQRVLRSAPCAVWVVKASEVREIREIALATDLSDAAQPALLTAIAVARALDARLYLIHAVDQKELSYLLMSGVSTAEIAAARQRMLDDAHAQFQARLAVTDYRTLPHGIRIEMLEGAPDEVIPKFVDENGIDILVLGTHGRTGLSRLVLGNTAERILPHVQCSVIAVKPADFVSPYAD